MKPRNKGLITTQARTVVHKSKKNYTRKNKHKNGNNNNNNSNDISSNI